MYFEDVPRGHAHGPGLKCPSRTAPVKKKTVPMTGAPNTTHTADDMFTANRSFRPFLNRLPAIGTGRSKIFRTNMGSKLEPTVLLPALVRLNTGFRTCRISV